MESLRRIWDAAILEFMADNGYYPEIRRIGVPDQFIEHGSVQQLYHLCGMDEEGIYKVITKNELRMDAPVESCMATHS